uniref:hypothetical protein n=1 Tax=Paractinoplanes polyasparticus TaxID=2856853 RepID=UPI001C861919|nr:hypothetical protein [Actinoplanes polyasparticus]
MALTFLEPLLANAPWAAVLIVCVIPAAIVIMFLWALLLVPKDKRVEAIEAMAKLVRELRAGKSRQLP